MEEKIKENPSSSKSNRLNLVSVIEKVTQVDREATKFEFQDLPLSGDCEK